MFEIGLTPMLRYLSVELWQSTSSRPHLLDTWISSRLSFLSV